MQVRNSILWQPWPGFQTRSMASSAGEALLGGAAGPGKTDIIIYSPLRFATKPWLRALILRRHLEDMQEIEDRLGNIIPRAWPGSKFNTQKRRWKLPAGGTLRMGYCDRFLDVDRYIGNQYTYIGWDEIGQVPEERWWTLLMSRLRSPDPEGQRHCYARCTANPGGVGHAWLKKRFVLTCGKNGERVYIDPRTGRSRAFIPGRLADNPILANDPEYVGRLLDLPEILRKQMLYGDWEAAVGLAFEELDEEKLLVPNRAIPPNWHVWGGFDWGFAHPAVLPVLTRDENGQRYVADTVWMRRLQPDQIAETGWERAPIQRMAAIYCGNDIRQKHRARGEDVPTIEEVLNGSGWPCAEAATDRKSGYAFVRDLLSYKRRGPGGIDKKPGLLFFDTPGNRRLLRQLSELVTDPDNPEDVLKVNADAGTGEGGDDGYDALRYGLVSHQRKGRNPLASETVRAFGEDALNYEIELRRVGAAVKPTQKRKAQGDQQWW